MNPIIQKTFDQVRSLFIYIPDKEQFSEKWDDWRSYANQVELGQIFKDDCDAFAMTCAELLVRRLIPNGVVRIVICKTETGEGHLVCIADGFVLDNRQRAIWNWNQIPYTWVSSMKMSEPGIWRSIN